MRRCLRQLDYNFRRARRVPPQKPVFKQVARVEKALGKLRRLERGGMCQIWYAIELLRISSDESGFCLQLSRKCPRGVPYLRQKKGHEQTVRLVSQAHGKRVNVLVFLRGCGGSLYHFPTQERFTAQHVVGSIEALLTSLRLPAVIVLDNASVHRCKQVQAKRAEWKKKGLRLLFLPPYCPHLNRIEILWKHVKYRWLTPCHYANFPTLTNILNNVGTQYRISFV